MRTITTTYHLTLNVTVVMPGSYEDHEDRLGALEFSAVKALEALPGVTVVGLATEQDDAGVEVEYGREV